MFDILLSIIQVGKILIGIEAFLIRSVILFNLPNEFCYKGEKETLLPVSPSILDSTTPRYLPPTYKASCLRRFVAPAKLCDRSQKMSSVTELYIGDRKLSPDNQMCEIQSWPGMFFFLL